MFAVNFYLTQPIQIVLRAIINISLRIPQNDFARVQQGVRTNPISYRTKNEFFSFLVR